MWCQAEAPAHRRWVTAPCSGLSDSWSPQDLKMNKSSVWGHADTGNKILEKNWRAVDAKAQPRADRDRELAPGPWNWALSKLS